MVWWGLVYEIMGFRQLLSVKPVPTFVTQRVYLKEAKKTVVGASRSLGRSEGARRSTALPIYKNGMLPTQ
jgi:hypothetical protein